MSVLRWLGRDPAWWTGLVAVLVQVGTAHGLDLSEPKQAAVNGGATAVMGFIVALTVAREQVLPAVSGLVVGVGELALQFHPFGWPRTPEQLASVSVLITIALMAYLRTQVTAPIAQDGSKVPRVSVGKGR